MIKIRYLILILTGTIFPFIQPVAQEIETEEEIQLLDSLPDWDVQPIDTLVDVFIESTEVDWQKLFEGWHASHFYNPEEHCEDDNVNPFFSDSVYRMRLSRMPVVVPMVYNEPVRKFIDYYAVRSRKWLRFVMGMSDYFFPMIEQVLDTYQLPLELKYLAVIESGLNPVALSRVGASGLWQFMLPTGKINGLEINSLIDERLDPEKATIAACRHLKMLYDLYDDWHLALAAYNGGHGAVNRAIARSGGKMDFWKILPYLPRETRAFVPKYIATAYIMTYHCEHNICPIRSNFSIATDTIMVERALHFDQVADIMQIDKEVVRFYNPQYKREIIPGNIQPSALRLPIERTIDFIEQADSVYTHRMEELLANCLPVDASEPKSRQERITHTVKAGETVMTIASLYGVTAQNLRRWNGLSGSRVAPGKKLVVNIDNGGLTFAAPKPPPTPTASAQTPTNAGTAPSSKTDNKSGTVTYQVQSGDSLYAIAKKYPGVTVQKIQEANGMTTINLRIGQILKIPL